MTMPSSDAELEERGSGGEENSLGGGDGVDLYEAELLLPGDVPAHDMPAVKRKWVFYSQGHQCRGSLNQG